MFSSTPGLYLPDASNTHSDNNPRGLQTLPDLLHVCARVCARAHARVQNCPGLRTTELKEYFGKAFWFCHLGSANWDELLLCYKGHLSKYRAVSSPGPDGAKRSLSHLHVPQKGYKGRHPFWAVDGQQGREAPGPSTRVDTCLDTCQWFPLILLLFLESHGISKDVFNFGSCVI